MTTTFTIYWISEDRQSSLAMGEYASREAAEADLTATKAMLRGQCSDDEQRAGIDAGFFEIGEEAK